MDLFNFNGTGNSKRGRKLSKQTESGTPVLKTGRQSDGNKKYWLNFIKPLKNAREGRPK
jgi:hypothetical protein